MARSWPLWELKASAASDHDLASLELTFEVYVTRLFFEAVADEEASRA